MNLDHLTQKFAAHLLGVTPRTLRDWAETDDPPPRNDDGSYPGPELVAWEVERRTTAAGALDPSAERARRDAEMADKLALANAVTRGELAVISDLEAVWEGHIAAVRARLLAMPSKLAPQLVGKTVLQIQGVVKAEVYAALSELAEYQGVSSG